MVNSPLWLVPALPLYTPTAATMVQVSSPNAEDGRRDPVQILFRSADTTGC